jgi:hypothetical protein
MQLTIELDKPGNVYLGGETISGRVILEADRAGDAPIYLNLGWKTSGKCNSESGQLHHQEITHNWQAGENIFPFKLRVPRGPFSYHGQLFELNWILKAEIDRFFAFQFEKTLEILPQPPLDATVIDSSYQGHIYQQAPETLGLSRSFLNMLWSNFAFFIIPIVLFVNFLPYFSLAAFILLVFLIFQRLDFMKAIFGSTILNKLFNFLQINIPINDLRFDFVTLVFPRNATSYATFYLKNNPANDRKNLSLIGLCAYLTCCEFSSHDSGKTTAYHHHVVAKYDLPMIRIDDKEFRFCFQVPFEIPSNALTSFMGESSALEWRLTIEYPVWGRLVWKREQIINVVP